MDEIFRVQSARFEDVDCDIYMNDREAYLTREQVGLALGYTDPRVAIAKIHNRHKERLDRYSVVTKLVSADGKSYPTVVYPRRGIMEICRWSSKPRADAFMDFVWSVMDALVTQPGRVQRERQRFGDVNAAARLLLRTLREADVEPKARLAALERLYQNAGIALLPEGLALEVAADCSLVPVTEETP